MAVSWVGRIWEEGAKAPCGLSLTCRRRAGSVRFQTELSVKGGRLVRSAGSLVAAGRRGAERLFQRMRWCPRNFPVCLASGSDTSQEVMSCEC